MSKSKAQQIFDDVKPEQAERGPSLAEKLKDLGGKFWDAAAPSVGHGSAELMAAVYTGAGHVMYGHKGAQDQQEQGKEQSPSHGLPEAAKQQEAQTPEQDRGMDM